MLSGEAGIIQELVSPWNPMRVILVVTGSSDEALSRASQALNRELHLLGMQGEVAIAQELSSPEPIENGQHDADFTVGDLGYEEEVVYGTRLHMVGYDFDMPVGCAWTENEGTLEVTFPPWLIRPGRNEILVSVEMNLDNEDKCLFLGAKHLWATIHRNSHFHLPCTPQDVEPTLDLFPYPFDMWPSLGGLLLVLPEAPRQFDYGLMLKVAAGLGAVDCGDCLALQVTMADLLNQENRQGKDLILMGRPTIHEWIVELNDRLPQPFEPNSDILRPWLESVVSAQDSSRSIGLIEEIAAPWDLDRTILVLTGTTDEGVDLATTTLFSRGDALSGNVVLVEESTGIRSFDAVPMLGVLGGQGSGSDVSPTLLIQLAERWW